MNNINKIITDPQIFSQKYIVREGFPFRCVTAPANIYDGIIIKPSGTECYSPLLPNFDLTLNDYIKFINKYKLEKAIIITDQIDFIKECPSLKYLMIIPSHSAGNRFDFSPLYQKSEYNLLDCSTVYGQNFHFKSEIDYSRFERIDSLGISGKGHKNLKSILSVSSIISHNLPCKNLYELFSSDALKVLNISSSPIVNLDGIEQSKELQCLKLSNNRNLSDLSALVNLKNSLRYLEIETCSKITDFSILEQLDDLEVLILYGSNSLQDVYFLNNLKNLKVFAFDFNVLNGDLSPCLNLKKVYSAVNRKHYNLLNKNLPKGIVDNNLGFKGIEEWLRF